MEKLSLSAIHSFTHSFILQVMYQKLLAVSVNIWCLLSHSPPSNIDSAYFIYV